MGRRPSVFPSLKARAGSLPSLSGTAWAGSRRSLMGGGAASPSSLPSGSRSSGAYLLFALQNAKKLIYQYGTRN